MFKVKLQPFVAMFGFLFSLSLELIVVTKERLFREVLWPRHANGIKMAVDLINIATHGEIGAIASLANELLLAISEDPDFMNQRDGLGKSALDITVMLDKPQLVQELIANGADVKTSPSNG